MRNVIAFLSMTLDGVMQAPGRADEDRRGGFEHGGWAIPYADAVLGGAAAESMAGTSALLLGRRTYEDFYAVWPGRKDNPFTEVLNRTQKYVASRTLKSPLAWQNSTLLEGDAGEAVVRLKATAGKDLVILGSGDLLQGLMRRKLIDRYVLLIHPLVLGAGSRVFAESGFAALRLVETKTTTTGVIIATYQPAASVAGKAAGGKR